ncbi:MAG: MMPL family transporter [Candidatus Bipolaricaulia bacterium]
MSLKLSTEALARKSGQRPWLIIGLWGLALLVALVLNVTLLGDALTTQQGFTNNPESKRADNLLEERLRGPMKANEIAIVRSQTLTVDDPAFKAYVEGLFADIMALGDGAIEQGINYYLIGDESLVSADRHTTILPLIMAGTLDDASENIDQLHDVIRAADGKDGFQTLITGMASVGLDFQEVAEQDLRTGEAIGVAVALFILLLVFGTLGATTVPIGLAIVSIVMALGATALIGQFFDFSFFVTNMITMMGLAVGIDYSLFIVSRYREERRRGLEKMDAIATAGATSSRAVFFSGMTVVLALLGMFIVPTTVFRSIALGAILVVIAAMLASLTLLPAVLSLMGNKVNSLRIPFLQRGTATRTAGERERGGFWNWVTRGVMRRPVIGLVMAAGLLIAAAVPYFDINTGSAGVSTLPDGLQSKEGFLILDEEFSAGLVSPAEIVIDGNISSQPVQAGIQNLQAALESDATFGPSRLIVNASGDLALLSVPVMGDANSDEAIDAIRKLRNQYIPQAFSGVQADVLVTGQTALNIDFFDLTDRFTPIVFVFVLGLSFLLLTVVFRSLVVPIKAIIMNLLSVGAAYGLVVLVFQKGVGASLLGFQQVETVEVWLPLFLFSILFGLSMDYHVFMLSRIRERYDQTGDNSESVAFGLRSTAGIITGAALIMVAVFGGFASGNLVMFQQFGFGLAVAIFLDATIVRSILVPATMKLLGRRNWYLPSVLRWLPEMRVETAETVPVPATEADSVAESSS